MKRQPRCWLRRPPKTGLAIKNMSGGERLKVGKRGSGQIPDTGTEYWSKHYNSYETSWPMNDKCEKKLACIFPPFRRMRDIAHGARAHDCASRRRDAPKDHEEPVGRGGDECETNAGTQEKCQSGNVYWSKYYIPKTVRKLDQEHKEWNS